MSRVVLVSPRVPMEPYFVQKELFPLGSLLLLGTILRKAGHQIKVIHEVADGFKTREALLNSICLEDPDIVGVNVTTLNCKSARDLCKRIKEVLPKTRVVAGGPHTSGVGRDGIKYPPEADIWVVGEGDNIILDIVEGRIKEGIHYPEMLPNLDNVPFLDMSLTDIKRFTGTYPPGPLPSMFVMGSRGCPYQCTFCCRGVFGKTVRQRNPESSVEETERLVTDLKLKEIFFHDDTFNINHKWSFSLLAEIRRRGLHKKVVFRTPCRVNEKLITEELLREMKASGFWLIFFGVENGSQQMLDSMKKGTTIEEIKRAFRLCHKVGINPEASFMIGTPGETLETIAASFKLCQEIKPFWAAFSRTTPYPNTELYETVKAKGHLLVNSFEEYSVNKPLVRTDAMTGEELEAEAQRLDKLMLRIKVRHLLTTHPERLFRVIKDSVDTGGGYRKVAGRILRVLK